LAPRARFELATLRLTAEDAKNLSALSGVAYKKVGAILTFLVAPNPAPNFFNPNQPEDSGNADSTEEKNLLQREYSER